MATRTFDIDGMAYLHVVKIVDIANKNGVDYVVSKPREGIATLTSKQNSRFVIKKFANQRSDTFLSPSGSAIA